MSYANHPNAALIDEVLAHVRAHPQRWADARDAAWDAAWGAAMGAAMGAARDAAWVDAFTRARYAALDAATGAARPTAWYAVSALVAFPEEAATLIRQEPDVVRMVASTGSHAAILLLPATIAMASKG